MILIMHYIIWVFLFPIILIPVNADEAEVVVCLSSFVGGLAIKFLVLTAILVFPRLKGFGTDLIKQCCGYIPVTVLYYRTPCN